MPRAVPEHVVSDIWRVLIADNSRGVYAHGNGLSGEIQL